MDSTAPLLDPSSEVNLRPDGRSACASLDNVLALLDDDRSRQLLQRVIPTVSYTGNFEVIGRNDGLDPPTELCAPCKELIQRPPPMCSQKDFDDSGGFIPAQFWVPHHDTLFQLIDCCSSHSGSCRLCQLLWHGIRHEVIYCRSNNVQVQTSDWLGAGLKMALRDRSTQFGSHQRDIPIVSVVLNVFPESGDAGRSRVVMGRIRSENELELFPTMAEITESETTFNQIQRWIDLCLTDHKSCRCHGPSNSERPTRLILMDHSTGTFRLTTDATPETRYAAVSYRWGGVEDYYMLTQGTAKGMREGISMEVLPQTILDTFTVAHRLGLQYIWVDRLCILQDSREDWSREASRMAFIYKHAFLTISASCASHENQGCFRKRSVAGIQPLRFNSNPLPLPKDFGWYENETSYITSEKPEENQRLGGKLGHLADRGWVFQERIFSQRIVYFSEEEVYWECRSLEASEAWPDGEPFKWKLRPSLGPASSHSGFHQLESLETWQKIVEAYSKRVFTYHGDKLPALSGLARETAELRKLEDPKEEYYAGLWRSTMLVDLCWSHDFNTLRIPEHYLAPSWSWASLHGEISYWDGLTWGFTEEAEFRDGRLSFAADDTYGAVHDGWIHLFGFLNPVTLAQHGNVPEPYQQHKSRIGEIRGKDGNPLPFLDFNLGKLDIETFAAGEEEPVPMFCLPLLEVLPPSGPVWYCLLLFQNGSIKHKRSGAALPSPDLLDAEQYQRAGVAMIEINNRKAWFTWLDENPPRDIIIR